MGQCRPLAKRFWALVQRGNPDACWEWQGQIQRRPDGIGYGLMRGIGGTKAKREYAHRVSFFIHHGRWPDAKMVIMHLCDNRRCVNPAHLREGTQGDNMRDAQTKGRLPFGERNAMRRPDVRAKVTGERNPMAKLTTEQVAEIRARRAHGEGNNTLARQYGVSPAMICRIVKGKAWK